MKIFLCLFMLLSFSVFAEEPRFSGKPLPRFMALKTDKANARVGPDVKYPIKYVYVRKFLPVVVVNEYYRWYQIEDIDGNLSWLYKDNFTNKTYAMVKDDNALLYKKPKMKAKVIANVNKGIIFFVDKCEGMFCKVKTNYNNKKYEGYISRKSLYGVN